MSEITDTPSISSRNSRNAFQHISVTNHTFGDNVEIDLEQFNKYGYLIIRNVFSPSELQIWRERITEVAKEQIEKGTIITPPRTQGLNVLRGELANIDLIRPILLNDRIADIAHQILGPDIVYYGDASIHYGNKQTSNGNQEGWHRDCPGAKSDPDDIVWSGDYPLIRFGLYFQDHENHSGGLSLIPESHADASVDGPQTPVLNRFGDLVVWNQRILHVGHIEKDGQQPDGIRIALFASFARPSAELSHYLRWMGGGSGWMGDRVVQDRWISTVVNDDFLSALENVRLGYFDPKPFMASLE